MHIGKKNGITGALTTGTSIEWMVKEKA